MNLDSDSTEQGLVAYTCPLPLSPRGFKDFVVIGNEWIITKKKKSFLDTKPTINEFIQVLSEGEEYLFNQALTVHLT